MRENAINGHGHSDYAGAFAYMKQLSGAQIAITQEDVPMIEDGSKSDFHYGKGWQVTGSDADQSRSHPARRR